MQAVGAGCLCVGESERQSEAEPGQIPCDVLHPVFP